MTLTEKTVNVDTKINRSTVRLGSEFRKITFSILINSSFSRVSRGSGFQSLTVEGPTSTELTHNKQELSLLGLIQESEKT